MLDKAVIFEASILIVDDLPANVTLLAQLLSEAGYQHISMTCNPLEVTALYQAQHHDLILLDLEMPGMDGFAVLQALQHIEIGGYSPVLVVAANPDHKLRALAAGARDFIAKPFDLIELKTRIYNLIEVRLLYKKLTQTVNTLEFFALHDALTGLPNRRCLLERLVQACRSSAQQPSYCALLFMDLDHFKQLNDTLGHDVGDALLQQVSVRLLQCVRPGDCVARLGGDEFVVLLDALSAERVQATAQAQAVALNILQTLRPSYQLKQHTCHNTLSIGAVLFAGDAELAGDLLKKADLAMYRAKSLGRNQVCFFDKAMLGPDTRRAGRD